MGHYLNLDADALAICRDATDDFIDVLGKNVTLYYPAVLRRCNNCVTDPVGGKSLNRWITGGPIQFSHGACPLCNGSGQFRASQASDSIRLHCAFDPKKFFYPVPNLNLRVPYGFVQTQGYLSDLPKVKRAEAAVFETEIEAVIKQQYILAGEPVQVENVVPGRYFFCMWERQ